MARVQQWRVGGSNGFLLALAVVAGIVAAVIVFVAVSQSDNGGSAAPVAADGVPTLVAADNINAGTRITVDMVHVVQVPETLLIGGVYTDSNVVVGEVARVAIASGEQITRAKIGFPVPDKGLSGVVPSGMRAVSVKIDEITAVGGNLLPGDHIDIVSTVRVDRAPNLAEDEHLLRTSTILQDVEVLSVAQEAQKPAAQAASSADGQPTTDSYTSGQLPGDVQQEPDAGTLTLALTPEQSLVLISEQEHAISVWAALRAFGDQTPIETAPYEVVVVDN